MNWGELKSKVLSRIHDPSLAAQAPDWFNEVQQEMVAAAQWRHLDADKTLPTTAPFTTGTASVATGSASVTFSDVLPADIVGQLFCAGGHYYKIAARTDDFTGALDSAYIGATDSAAAFSIVFFQLTLPDNFSPPRLYNVLLQTGDGVDELHYSPDHELFQEWPDESRTIGHPTLYRFHAGAMQLWPPPDGAYNVKIFYHRVPSEVTSSSPDATPIDWPSDLQYALLQGVFAVAYEHVDDSLAVRCRGRFENALNAAVSRNNRPPGTGGGRLQKWDKGSSHRGMNYRLPEPIG